MGIGWILGLLGGGLSIAGLGLGALALMGFVPPTVWANILEAAKAALEAALKGLKWLTFTPEGRQVLFACTTLLAFWWSGQRGWDRGVAWRVAQERALGKQSHAIGIVFAGRIVALNDSVKSNLAADFKRTDLTYDSMLEEVSRRVTPQIDRRYPLPCILVRVHDAALIGVDPASLAAAGCERDDAAAPTTASAFSRSEVEWGRYTRKLESDNAALRATITGYEAAYAAWRAQLKAVNK